MKIIRLSFLTAVWLMTAHRLPANPPSPPRRTTKNRARFCDLSAVLRLNVEYCCEFSYELLKLTRTTGSPVGKMSRERVVGICGAAEKSQGSPAARFFFNNREKLGRNDRITITPGGILAQSGLVRAEPNHERGSCRQMVLRQGQSFLRIRNEPWSIVPPGRIRRRDPP